MAELERPPKPWRLNDPDGTVELIDGKYYLCLKGPWQIQIDEAMRIAYARQLEIQEAEIDLLTKVLIESNQTELRLMARVQELEAKVSQAVQMIRQLKGK
jgi:hypothetical protein